MRRFFFIPLLALGACATPRPSRQITFGERRPANSPIEALEIDYVKIRPGRASELIRDEPIRAFKGKNVKYNGFTLQAYVLKTGESVFVHSNRYLWSKRVSGQAFFDTFLFGCEDLPPSPLGSVTSDGLRMHHGEAALIEEYPDHVATLGNQPLALIQCE